MSQFQLFLLCPLGSLEHFTVCVCAHTRLAHLAAMQNKTQYELIVKLTGPILGLSVLTAL